MRNFSLIISFISLLLLNSCNIKDNYKINQSVSGDSSVIKINTEIHKFTGGRWSGSVIYSKSIETTIDSVHIYMDRERENAIVFINNIE